MTDFSLINITGILLGLTTLFLVLFPISGKGHDIKNIPLILIGVGFLAQFSGLKVYYINPYSESGLNLLLGLTEALVVIALAAAGLSIKTTPQWKNWNPAYLLVLGTMPLMIGLTSIVAFYTLGTNLASSLLLGAVLAPTDPVLARTVQVEGPKEKEKENPLKLALTSEAGLNDGLAFPFVYLAIAVASFGGSDQISWSKVILHWTTVDLFARIIIGSIIGIGFGYFGAKAASRFKKDDDHDEFFGIMVIGAVLATYFIAELFGGYGFLAAFLLTLVGRQVTQKQHGSEKLILPHAFSDQIEVLLTSVCLLWLGMFLAENVVSQITYLEILFSLLLVVILRPLTGILSLVFSSLGARRKIAASVLGIKGMGSVFYLCYAVKNAQFENLDNLWRIVGMVILISVIIHGFAADCLIRWSGKSSSLQE